eukprot:gnl/TRDRNA2_/TRDRNA2_154788_c1_seq1.p2 gnl/TRDRNA2_/TRDRNA2_154788_c1~~gnl/TRDRNA2_/TRDRNA2_154788_c1_seq1.p2  ORF type:complete len:101 (-),score=17.48 gnl/TRDRNA2_/TRDRNA2_154788_c1_seq1:26-328(-)
MIRSSGNDGVNLSTESNIPSQHNATLRTPTNEMDTKNRNVRALALLLSALQLNGQTHGKEEARLDSSMGTPLQALDPVKTHFNSEAMEVDARWLLRCYCQ